MNSNTTNRSKVQLNDIVWRNVLKMSILHVLAIHGLYLIVDGQVKWQTVLFCTLFLAIFSGIGITAGAHRLWCHRSYKAKWPLRVLLVIQNTMALQNDIYEWCRDHRTHHKYAETDADPHNVKRGFFFAHIGWILVSKQPDVINGGKTIDMSDLLADPIVCFQRKYYIPLVIFFWAILPTVIPVYTWNELPWNSFLVCVIYRYVFSLHSTWLVNSAAHLYGNRPYDGQINARENKLVVQYALGEGYHNYHHTFPWDYSASEFGWKDGVNISTMYIDLFAKLGWAYDLKKPSKSLIDQRVQKLGDNTRPKKVVTLFDLGLFFAYAFMPIAFAFITKNLIFGFTKMLQY